jgi:hypothetical protein
MKFEIKNRFNGAIIFSVEAENWRFAVEAAIKGGANLSKANLSKADLRTIKHDVWGVLLQARAEVPALRFLSAPIMGFVYWTMDNNPVRAKEPFEGVPSNARLDEGKFKPKHFWAAVVWNFAESRVQIMEITQASVQGPILDLASNEDWGDPRDYNLTINKKGQKLDTEYTVQPSPKSAIPAEAFVSYRMLRETTTLALL